MKKSIIIIYIIIIGGLSSCEDMLRVETPKDQTMSEEVFSNDELANAAVAGLYRSLVDSPILSSTYTASVLTGLAGDELLNFSVNIQLEQFYENDIMTNNSFIESGWNRLYNCIYQANAILEGLSNKNSISIPQEKQEHFSGEAKFARALCYFYLQNLYGNIPLITSTEASVNQNITNTSKEEVFELIVSDLESAVELLDDEYSQSNGMPIRANKWAATALLARINLYLGNWSEAENLSSDIIQSQRYSLVDLENVFLANSQEAILQWGRNPNDGISDANAFIPGANQQPNIVCSVHLLNTFESGDLRGEIWINSLEFLGETYFYPYKYTDGTINTNNNHTVLRLAEQYLIRAEARAHQNNIGGAISDINLIRGRALLPEINQFISQDSCLSVVLKERRNELFAENGHRWFDLKRLGIINEALSQVKQNWQPTDALFPIPLSEIQRNTNLTQNPGYN